MNQPAKAQEPSMEEILASIRRIIADDDAVKPAAKAKPEPPPVKAAPPPPPAPPATSAPMGQDDIDAMLAGFDEAAEEPEPAAPEPQEDVLELTEAMAAPQPQPSFRKIDAHQDVVFDEAPAAPPPRQPAPSPRIADSDDPPLLSASTTAAVNSAFGSLAHTVLVQNAKTLEDLVKEMLRPMLKTWLDDNLPSMVERLVRAEIERVSRGHQS
jgi:cell pole-organizing protein PopZ